MSYETTTKTRQREAVIIIPCGGSKQTTTAPAADLYTGSLFRETLAAALHQVDGDRSRVLILSALHGLLTLDEPVAPYDVRMGQPAAIDRRPGGLAELASQLVAHGLVSLDEDMPWGVEVYAFLPAAYLAALETAAACWDLNVLPLYEGLRGVGEQKTALMHARH